MIHVHMLVYICIYMITSTMHRRNNIKSNKKWLDGFQNWSVVGNLFGQNC